VKDSKRRPSFADIYMRHAKALSERSTCARMPVGCVITSTDFRYVYGAGYNGSAAGDANDCDRHGEAAVGNCGCLHAEANAVVNNRADREKKKIVFCTHLPCVGCAKLLINMGGVQKVYYGYVYRVQESLQWFARAGIECEMYSDEPEDAACSET